MLVAKQTVKVLWSMFADNSWLAPISVYLETAGRFNVLLAQEAPLGLHMSQKKVLI